MASLRGLPPPPFPPARKLVIRPLQRRPRLPDDFEASSWAVLEGAVRGIQLLRPVGHSLETLYGIVEDLCQHGFAGSLYARLERELGAHAARVVGGLSARASLPARAFLESLVDDWEDYCRGLLLIRQVFLHLDRQHRASRDGRTAVRPPPPSTATPGGRHVEEVYGSGGDGGGGGGGGGGTAGSGAALASPSPPTPRSALLAPDRPPLPLFDLGLELFRVELEAAPEAAARAVRGLLDAIRDDRIGPDRPDTHRLWVAVDIHVSLGRYTDAAEPGLLRETGEHYERLAAEALRADDVAGYLERAERALEAEKTRALEYLPASTRRPLLEIARDRLVGRHVPELLSRGLDDLLRSPARAPDLARMRRLLASVRALEPLRVAFRAHVRTVGSALVALERRDAELVPALLAWKASLDAAVAGPLGGADSFAAALREGFEHVMNARGNRPAELLARHIDGLLRGNAPATPSGLTAVGLGAAAGGAVDAGGAADAGKRGEAGIGAGDDGVADAGDGAVATAPPAGAISGAAVTPLGTAAMGAADRTGRGPGTASLAPSPLPAALPPPSLPRPPPLTEEQIEAALDAALALFRFVRGKDAFEAFYKRDLARRLLLGRSAGEDLERAAIARLKAECGPGFTSKLEGMFKDVEISRDLSAAYKAARGGGGAGATDGATSRGGAAGGFADGSSSGADGRAAPASEALGEAGSAGARHARARPPSGTAPAVPHPGVDAAPSSVQQQQQQEQRVETAAFVLTAGFWPTYGGAGAGAPGSEDPDPRDSPPAGADADGAAASPAALAAGAGQRLALPPALAKEREQFSDFYLAAHGGRRLAWAPALSSVVLRARFDQGWKDLTVSLYQALVLLAFDEDDGDEEEGEDAAGDDACADGRGHEAGRRPPSGGAGVATDAASTGADDEVAMDEDEDAGDSAGAGAGTSPGPGRGPGVGADPASDATRGAGEQTAAGSADPPEDVPAEASSPGGPATGATRRGQGAPATAQRAPPSASSAPPHPAAASSPPAPQLSIPELAHRTGVPEGELRTALMGLACGRDRVLRKHPAGREVGDGDRFSFDASFSSRSHRVRLNAAQLRDGPRERRATSEAVAQDRQHQLDAAVVRVMKARGSAGHKALLAELAAQLRFPFAAADLKRRLESLIDREYIERDPRNPQVYNYVA